MHEPWITAVLQCRETCAQKQPCIQDRCYKEAGEAYPPLSGGGAKLTIPYYLRRVTGKNVRLVIMLRDPTERLHSSFWYYEHYQARSNGCAEFFTPVATCLLYGRSGAPTNCARHCGRHRIQNAGVRESYAWPAAACKSPPVLPWSIVTDDSTPPASSSIIFSSSRRSTAPVRTASLYMRRR